MSTHSQRTKKPLTQHCGHSFCTGIGGGEKKKKDDRATQRAFRSTPLPTLGDDAHPAAHAAPRVRGLVHVPGATLAGAEQRVRLGGVPHAHVARAPGSDGGAADRAGHDHARERRVVALVRQRGGEGARGRGAEARRGAARARADRFGAAQDRAVRSQALVRWEDIDWRGRTRGACHSSAASRRYFLSFFFFLDFFRFIVPCVA